MTKQAGLEPSITSSCKLMFDAIQTRLVESDDTGSYFLVTWKVLNELDDVNLILPLANDILVYDGANWINAKDYSIFNSILLSTGLAWNYLTRTLSLLNPLPSNTSNSVLTTSNSGTSQWTQFTTGSTTKYAALCYNGIGFSG